MLTKYVSTLLFRAAYPLCINVQRYATSLSLMEGNVCNNLQPRSL